jgi:hypothetical protein
VFCRAAVDLQIKQQKAQRDQLEALKQQELQEERQELQCWQQQLPEASAQQQLDQGDESEYEDDTTDADAEVISVHDKQQDSVQRQDGTADEPYHGRGYWPSKAAATATTGNSSSEQIAHAASQEQELTEVSTSSKHDDANGSLQYLVGAQTSANEAGAACKSMMLNTTNTDSTAAEEPFLSASSTRRLTPAKAAVSKHTTKLGSSSRTTTSSSSSSNSRQPQKPVAPVRSRAAPVQVTFTQLETPHLPARQQREVEIKQIKQAAGHKVSCPGALRSAAGVCAHTLFATKLAQEREHPYSSL